jgi:hypothetical protein
MRLNDARNGTDVVEDVLTKYKAAWAAKGMLNETGLLNTMWLVKQDTTVSAKDPGLSAWASAFMNSWNSDFVRKCYDRQALGFLTNIDGEVRLQIPPVGNAYRNLINNDSEKSASPRELLEKATEIGRAEYEEKVAAQVPGKALTFLTKPMFGYVSKWLSELGKPELDGLLKYADDHLHPTWENGGLFYRAMISWSTRSCSGHIWTLSLVMLLSVMRDLTSRMKSRSFSRSCGHRKRSSHGRSWMEYPSRMGLTS